MIIRCALLSLLLVLSGCSPVVINVVLPGARVNIGWRIDSGSYAGAVPDKAKTEQTTKWEPLVQ